MSSLSESSLQSTQLLPGQSQKDPSSHAQNRLLTSTNLKHKEVLSFYENAQGLQLGIVLRVWHNLIRANEHKTWASKKKRWSQDTILVSKEGIRFTLPLIRNSDDPPMMLLATLQRQDWDTSTMTGSLSYHLVNLISLVVLPSGSSSTYTALTLALLATGFPMGAPWIRSCKESLSMRWWQEHKRCTHPERPHTQVGRLLS